MPAAPYGLTATATGSGFTAYAALSWTNGETYDSIVIYRKIGSEFYSGVGSASGTATSFNDTTYTYGHGSQATYYVIGIKAGILSASSNTATATISLAAPTMVSVQAVSDDEIQITWTNNDTYQYIYIYWNYAGSYSFMRSEPGSSTGYTDVLADIHKNLAISYKVTGVYWGVESDYSSEGGPAGCWYDDVTEALTATEATPDEAIAVGASIYESVGITETVTDSAAIPDTVSETISVTDTQQSAQTIRTDFAYYWGSTDGNVYVTSDTYKSDNGTSIQSTWKSKVTDFSDISPEFTNKWKTIYYVKLTYIDKEASTPVWFYYSTDESTWTSINKTLGSGDDTVKDTYFHFIKTGMYFQFRVEWPSANKTFQFLGIEAFWLPSSEAFVIA